MLFRLWQKPGAHRVLHCSCERSKCRMYNSSDFQTLRKYPNNQGHEAISEDSWLMDIVRNNSGLLAVFAKRALSVGIPL